MSIFTLAVCAASFCAALSFVIYLLLCSYAEREREWKAIGKRLAKERESTHTTSRIRVLHPEKEEHSMK